MTAPPKSDSIDGRRPPDPRDFAGRGVVVIGMARSGLAAARMLAGAGARVFVTDAAPVTALTERIAELQQHQIAFEVGGHTLAPLDKADWIVASPGVPPDNLLLRAAAERGIPVISEIEAAFRLSPAPVLAVTGSNGKTTTTSWLGAIYRGADRPAEVGGNIGRAYSDFAADLQQDARAILEVSTFQLEQIDTFRPHVAAILNLTPDHLDRHGSFDTYVDLKFQLLANQQPDDIALLNADDPVVVVRDRKNLSGRGMRWWFSAKNPVSPGVWLTDDGLAYDAGTHEGTIPGSDRLIPPGEHNRMNAAAAVAIALADGLAPEDIAPGLTSFAGVEHRLETVAEIGGVLYINDSKATNPDSVAKALVAGERPLVVIMGGLDKGTSFSGLAGDLKRKARAVVFTGRAATRLVQELGGSVSHHVAPDFAEAFAAAVALAQAGDAVLLSPGCASFDQFDNYEHRGRVFKDCVARLQAESGGPPCA